MIYIITAMGCEAKPLIDFFKLKKDNTIKKFQVFKNENITLMISGVGPIKSAIATTHLFSNFAPLEKDIIINLGVCGAKNRDFTLNEMVICNKIRNSITKRNFYPDMFFLHPFKEVSLETFGEPIFSDFNIESDIVDMEGASFFEAASLFFENHQIFTIKIVSDFLNKVNEIDIHNMIFSNLPQFEKWILNLHSNFPVDEDIFTKEEVDKIILLSEKLKLTESMKHRLIELLKFRKLQNNEFLSIIDDYFDIEITNKREVKKIFDEIEKRTLNS